MSHGGVGARVFTLSSQCVRSRAVRSSAVRVLAAGDLNARVDSPDNGSWCRLRLDGVGNNGHERPGKCSDKGRRDAIWT